MFVGLFFFLYFLLSFFDKACPAKTTLKLYDFPKMREAKDRQGSRGGRFLVVKCKVTLLLLSKKLSFAGSSFLYFA